LKVEIVQDIFEYLPHYPETLLRGFAQMSPQVNRYLRRTKRGYWNANQFFQVKEILGPPQQTNRLISCSLFKAPLDFERMSAQSGFDYDAEISINSLKKEMCSASIGRKQGKSFFEAYVEPFLMNLPPDWDIRVYLAPNMPELAEVLVENGVQVYVMASPSVSHSPGSCWRYLACDDKAYDFVYLQDTDRPFRPASVEQQRVLESHPCGSFARVLQRTSEQGHIALILGNNFTVRPNAPKSIFGQDWENAMRGYTNMSILRELTYDNFPGEAGRYQLPVVPALNERLNRQVVWPNKEERRHGAWFPFYPFDEQFLKECVYARVTKQGAMITFADKQNLSDDLQQADLRAQNRFGNMVIGSSRT
jgi:hypothetical protein